jgi:signal transduction histidine kinase
MTPLWLAGAVARLQEQAQAILNELSARLSRELDRHSPGDYPADHERLQAGLASQLRADERARIAQELHDDLGSALTAIKLDVAQARQAIFANPNQAASKLDAVAELLDASVERMGHIIHRLRPPVLDQLDLLAALEWQFWSFLAHTGLEGTIEIDCEPFPVDPGAATSIFRIVQEALTNVARHAQASHVEVRVQHVADEPVLTIQDNGCDYDGQAPPQALGVTGMRQRAAALGGVLRVQGTPGRGTTVELRCRLDGLRLPPN